MLKFLRKAFQSHLSIMLDPNLLQLVSFFVASVCSHSVGSNVPNLTVGTINGTAMLKAKLNVSFFQGSVPVVSQFISWLNLDLGIEVCLFDGLDGYWNTWLQFAFPAYLFLLRGCITVGCHYSVWLCRLCGSHAVPA